MRIDSGTSGNVAVNGSYLGTSPDGLGVPTPMQGNGVVVNNAPGGATITIGAALAGNRNLISGNLNHGIVVSADNVAVQFLPETTRQITGIARQVRGPLDHPGGDAGVL